MSGKVAAAATSCFEELLLQLKRFCFAKSNKRVLSCSQSQVSGKVAAATTSRFELLLLQLKRLVDDHSAAPGFEFATNGTESSPPTAQVRLSSAYRSSC